MYYLAEKYNTEALRDKILFIIPMHMEFGVPESDPHVVDNK
jgi:hypothetical protein